MTRFFYQNSKVFLLWEPGGRLERCSGGSLAPSGADPLHPGMRDNRRGGNRPIHHCHPCHHLKDALSLTFDTQCHPQVRDMLGHKVSRERIGTELDGMIKGPDPLMALDLLRAMRLFEAVFEVHPSAAGGDVPAAFAAAGSELGKSACDALSTWGDVFEGKGDGPGVELDFGCQDVRRQTILGALLLPLRHARVPLGKNKTQSMASHVVRDSLKWKSKDADTIDLMHEVAPELVDAHVGLREGRDDARLRIKLGRCVKRLRHTWPSGVILSCLLCREEARPIGVEEAVEEEIFWGGGLGSGDREMCESLASAVRRFGIQDCWQWKPLLNGKEVMVALDIKGGPGLGAAMDACFDYQLVNPSAARDDVLEWLKAKFEAGAIQDGSYANEL